MRQLQATFVTWRSAVQQRRGKFAVLFINQATSEIASGVQLDTETNDKIKTAVDSVTQISSLIEETKAGADEQKLVIEQISESMTPSIPLSKNKILPRSHKFRASSSFMNKARQLMDRIGFCRLREESRHPHNLTKAFSVE
ncbi:hypothetical protein D8M09_12405 [Enterobacter sp. R1(2018)]|nr:hypothetical protein D8M09_12405 [Enterobacter sp. R1(2018)]